jgi:hypothetical protein
MGLTVIDAGVIIGFLDANDSHHLEAHAALDDARSRKPLGAAVGVCRGLGRPSVNPQRRRSYLTSVPIDVGRWTSIAMLAPLFVLDIAPSSFRTHSSSQPRTDADHLITTDRKWPLRSTLKLRASSEI